MTLTKEKYLSQLDRIHCIFQNTLDQIFTNPCSREETVLHSFYIERSASSTCIYFDKQALTEKEIKKENGISDHSFIQDYLTKSVGYQIHIYRCTETIPKNGSFRKVYWTLSSECLDSHHGDLMLNCLLQQLTTAFSKFVDQASDWQSMSEEEKANDSSIRTAEIIRSVEQNIDTNLQTKFKPFQIDWVNILSGEYYERSECRSNIIFLPNGAKNKLTQEDWIFCFEKTPFLPQNSRLIRKWLQMTQDNMNLVACADKLGKVFNIHGICNTSVLADKLQNTNGLALPYLRVEIQKHMVWKLFLNDQYIFTIRNGHYKIERKIRREYLRKRLTDCFGEKEHGYDVLIENIIRSTNQNHGTMLVVMEPDDAREETARLGKLKYGFAESNPQVQTDTINHLSAIDGSIIIDTNGMVHGIGIILDGFSSDEGRLERGARYNSAKKYLNALLNLHADKPIQGLAVVISDDGYVDILPQ